MKERQMPLNRDSNMDSMHRTGSTCESEDRIRRIAGICGLGGALLFFAGDIVCYGYVGPGSGFSEGMLATVMHESQERLFAGGLVGPVAAYLCIVGFWHLYLNMQPTRAFLRRLTFALFAALMVAGSAVHTLWTAKGLALKYCYDQGAPCPALITAISSYWSLAYNMGAFPGYAGSALLAALVVTGKTFYPRWTVLVNPGLLIRVLLPFARLVPAPLGAILVGGFTNLSIAAFFLVSVVTTWKGEQFPLRRSK